MEEANRAIEDEARRSVWMEATRLSARMEADEEERLDAMACLKVSEEARLDAEE